MDILCLQHVAFEGPGILEPWLEHRGVRLRKHLVPEGELPDPSPFRSVIVMGGPMNIYQHRDHPWLPAEKQFLRRCLNEGIPLLGICLGAQLIADTLGARVVQGPHREIGWFPIETTADMRHAAPGLPASLDVLHWHGDTFERPPGSIQVARSAACEEQGFYHPGCYLGLQFHVESTPESVENLLHHCGDELTPGAYIQTPAQIREGLTRAAFAPWEPLFTELLRV